MRGTILQFPMAVAAAAFFTLMTLTFADVILRSAFDAPIEAATELTRILMAIIVFSALPETTWRGEHVTVDLLDGSFHRRGLSSIRDAAVNLACGILLLFPARRIVTLAERAREYGDSTEYLNIPVFYVGWFVALSVFLTIGVLLYRGVLCLSDALSGKRRP